MTLADVILSIEQGTFTRTGELDATIEIQIREEISAAQQSETRSRLFSDVRKLNDILVNQYLSVDFLILLVYYIASYV